MAGRRGDQITRHEVAVYRTLAANTERWLTNKDIASIAGIADRTVRNHTARLVQEGMLRWHASDRGYLLRLHAGEHTPTSDYRERLLEAVEIHAQWTTK
jgi:DNA-binding IclR family transcriptional regulator